MSEPASASVTFTLTEPTGTPWLGMFFGTIAMVSFVIGVLASGLTGDPWRGAALAVTLLLGCAILTFLAGVRRGVSFRTPGGATAAQTATVLWLFCLGSAAVVLTAIAMPVSAAGILLAGYLTLQVFDPMAARRLEAPRSFARPRPAQMAIPSLCLVATLVLLLVR